MVSLLTNILSTSIVGLKAWKHRQWIKHDLKLAHTKTSRSEKVLVLLIESGLFYCISGVSSIQSGLFTLALTKRQATVLICSVVRLPVGTLGDIYTPVNVQIAVSAKSLMSCLKFIPCRAFIQLLCFFSLTTKTIKEEAYSRVRRRGKPKQPESGPSRALVSSRCDLPLAGRVSPRIAMLILVLSRTARCRYQHRLWNSVNDETVVSSLPRI